MEAFLLTQPARMIIGYLMQPIAHVVLLKQYTQLVLPVEPLLQQLGTCASHLIKNFQAARLIYGPSLIS